MMMVATLLMLAAAAQTHGVLLENLTWPEAEKVLTRDAVVVIPLGAESKEHGPHLALKNDFLIAEYLKRRVVEKAEVIVAPTVNYSFYPAFVEYPGSTSLRFDTARDMIIDICRTLARPGPRRFYVINTGVSTRRPLKAAADVLKEEGILLRFTDLDVIEPVAKTVRKEPGGSHADEIETSMMLYIAPESVDMKKAVNDYHGDHPGPLTRDPKNEEGTYSASGVWGDATLATREKGRIVTEALVSAMLGEIEALRREGVGVPGR